MQRTKAFRNDVADQHARIHRRERILKHDLHVRAFLPQRIDGQLAKIDAVEPDPPESSRNQIEQCLPSVVLPQPDSPTSARVLPCGSVKLTPSTART